MEGDQDENIELRYPQKTQQENKIHNLFKYRPIPNECWNVILDHF